MTLPLGETKSDSGATVVNRNPSLLPAADAAAISLASAISRGDERAFQQLYDSYSDRIFRFTLVWCKGDEMLAREVLQSTMLTAAAKLKPVASESHLWNWLARVARQHLIKLWRQQRREPKTIALAELSDASDLILPEAVLENHLDAALLTLTPDDREAIEWFYFDGLSHKEIASRCQSTPKAVSSRLDRARAKLRQAIKQILSHEN